jgi:hypothetical protein
MIHAFGDSFVVGDQDDYINDKNTDPESAPTHNMSEATRTEYLKYNVSFAALIAKQLDTKLKNHAVRGTGNFPQLDLLFDQLNNKEITSNDVVLFGITTGIRDRAGLLDYNNLHKSLSVLHLGNWAEIDAIPKTDQFYVLSILSQLSLMFNVRIIKFNLFTRALDYKFDDYLTGTLVDILNDTYAQGITHPYHDQLKIPAGYQELYTYKKHPSIAGHKKIAHWFLDNIKFNE